LLGSGACLLQRSKLRKLPGLLAAATQQAPKLLWSFSSSKAYLQQSKLRSLLVGVFIACKEEGLLFVFTVEKKKAFFFFFFAVEGLVLFFAIEEKEEKP
jgi:hypothetical protein